jgi:toxin ParE1/3/4
VKTKLVVPRQLAGADVDDAVAHCLAEGGEPVALGFVDALAQAYAHKAGIRQRGHHATPMN